jgi:hypothetical protein
MIRLRKIGGAPADRMAERRAGRGRLAAWTLFAALSLAAATNPETLPKLRPPLDEIPPTFWEEYGLAAVVGGILTLLLLGAVGWLATRPKPVPAPRPEAIARRALDPLRGQPEDGLLLSRVSRVLRRYLSAAFGLPPEQMTTTEFCAALTVHPGVGPELAAAAADFLRRCDERKFAPLPPAPAFGAVDSALKLVEAAEQHLARQPHPGQVPIPAEARGPTER